MGEKNTVGGGVTELLVQFFFKITVSCYNAPTALLVWLPTYTPSAASKVAVTFVARTLSVDANWISVATVLTLTMFTCA